VGNDVGGRLARKNAKIPDVVKVNNYRYLIQKLYGGINAKMRENILTTL
jgi:hypothetical protein